MSYAVQYSFNLFFNSTCSFIAGLVVVSFAIWFFRVEQSRWKLFLLGLPFVKMIWDLAYRRIPTSSIVHAGVNPLDLPPHSQMLTIGGGFSKFGPIFNLVFTLHGPDGKQYSASFADYFYALTGKHMGRWTPEAVLIGAITVSALLLVRRMIQAWSFESQRRKWRLRDHSFESVKCGARRVDIYISSRYEGTPFTGGVIRPYICIPQKTYEVLSEGERNAVIQHELGHVRHWDLVGTLAVQSLGDLFWFVPFYRTLSRKIDRLREILADDSALHANVAPEYLASALVTLQNSKMGVSDSVLYSAFFREKQLVQVRVARLLNKTESRSRFGWRHAGLRILITAWTAGAVMIATFGGNHEVSVRTVSSWLDVLPNGIGSVLKAWGFN